MTVTKVLFVCMGNICRSPTAHGVMQHKVNQRGLSNRIHIDSSGTHAYHVGEKSDARSRATAAGKGIDMEFIRARKISINDYDEFDYTWLMPIRLAFVMNALSQIHIMVVMLVLSMFFNWSTLVVML